MRTKASIVLHDLITRAKDEALGHSRKLSELASKDDTSTKDFQLQLDDCTEAQARVDGLTFLQTQRKLRDKHGKVTIRTKRKVLLEIRRELADLAMLTELESPRWYANYATARLYVNMEYNRLAPQYNTAGTTPNPQRWDDILSFEPEQYDEVPDPIAQATEFMKDFSHLDTNPIPLNELDVPEFLKHPTTN